MKLFLVLVYVALVLTLTASAAAQEGADEESGALSNTVWVALIVAVGSLTSTALVAFATNRRERARQVREASVRREEKEEDWKRQDKVAERAEAAALRVAEVAAQASKAAALLVERQDAATRAAEVAASDLVEANDRLARETMRAATVVNDKLDQIHTLVNSNLLEAKQDRLTAHRALIVALRKDPSPSEADRKRIDMLEATAVEYEAEIADRKRQTLVAEAKIEQGSGGSLKAEWERAPGEEVP